LGETDELFLLRWDYCLYAMIHAFELVLLEVDGELLSEEDETSMKFGLFLFGKYFRALWQ